MGLITKHIGDTYTWSNGVTIISQIIRSITLINSTDVIRL